jgi:hypothetical protein
MSSASQPGAIGSVAGKDVKPSYSAKQAGGKFACRRRGGTIMIGVSVVFDYNGDFDRSRVIEVAKNARTMFEGLPGLRFKVFTLDEKQQRAMNFYLWDSQEAAEAFFSEELRERVTGLYGVSPTVSFLEIAELVDNS